MGICCTAQETQRGPLCQSRGVRCGGRWGGWVQGSGPKGGLGGLPTPLVVLCAWVMHRTWLSFQYRAFAPSSSEVAVGFLVFWHLAVHTLP